MKWNNLRINKCPKCNKEIINGLVSIGLPNHDKMMNHPCGFMIRESRYSQIVRGQVTAELEAKWESELEEGGE